MRKKKILFIMHELSTGGAERVITNLANNIDRAKFDVHFCLFKKKGLLVTSLKDDITLHDLQSSRVLKGALKIASLILKLKPDVVFSSITHVNLLISIQLIFLKRIIKNTIFISREVNIPSIRAKHTPHSRRLDFFYKFTIKNFDHIIAQSKFMKGDLVKSYNLDHRKIKIINNPIDTNRINKMIETTPTNNNPFSSSKINILAVGSLKNQKGFETLLQTVPYFDNNLHLNIIGEGPKRKSLEELVLELKIEDKVTLHGLQENPYRFIKHSDLIVLSSLYEGFPNAILEANACGKFVVALECPGVDSEIITNEINGFLIKSRDKETFAAAINKYSQSPHNKEKIIGTTDQYEVSNVVMEYECLFLN